MRRLAEGHVGLRRSARQCFGAGNAFSWDACMAERVGARVLAASPLHRASCHVHGCEDGRVPEFAEPVAADERVCVVRASLTVFKRDKEPVASERLKWNVRTFSWTQAVLPTQNPKTTSGVIAEGVTSAGFFGFAVGVGCGSSPSFLTPRLPLSFCRERRTCALTWRLLSLGWHPKEESDCQSEPPLGAAWADNRSGHARKWST